MTDQTLTSNERAADVPREVLLGKTLRQRAHQLRIEACSAWSAVAEKPITGLDAAKCDYARAIEERLRSIIDELADLSSAIEMKPNGNETSERQPAVAVLREVLENISTVSPLEHFPAVTALAYCREKAIEALNATSAFQEVIVGEYEADGKVNMASSPLPEGTKLYARLPLRHSEKAELGGSFPESTDG